MSIKILHIITGLSSGGAETSLYRLLATSNRERFEPSVLSLLDEGTYGARIKRLDIPLHCLRMRRGVPTWRAAAELRRIVKEVAPDIVQGWMYHANLAGTIGCVLSRLRPQVLWNVRHALHDDTTEARMTRWMIRASAFMSNRPTRIIYNSRVSARQHEVRGFKPDKTVVVPNGFDCTEFRPVQEAGRSLRRALGVPEGTLLVGMVARYHPVKGHSNFLNAAERLRSEGRPIHLVLAGSGVEGGNRELVALVTGAGFGPREVSLLGERNDIAELTAGFDIACSASLSEGFPNVVGEAMACGVPCVVTDVGDSAYLVGDTGKVVPPNDSAALGNAIGALADLRVPGRAALGAAARARILRKFSLPAVVQQYENLYQAVLPRWSITRRSM